MRVLYTTCRFYLFVNGLKCRPDAIGSKPIANGSLGALVLTQHMAITVHTRTCTHIYIHKHVYVKSNL